MALEQDLALARLLQDVRSCRLCEAILPLGPRPIVAVSQHARILIIGQAPGTKVHSSGIAWNDPSGDRLRRWLNLSHDVFYDTNQIGIMPMGFCYPGRGRSGDLPPRSECAPAWHKRILDHLPNIRLTLLIGSYAVNYYLKDFRSKTLKDTIARWHEMPDCFLALPHPSPRNTKYIRDNSWFETDLVPELQKRVHSILPEPV